MIGLKHNVRQIGMIHTRQLYEGKLVPRDEIAACQWATIAGESGSKEAKSLLREMELFLSPTQLAEARKHAAEFKPLRRGTTRL